VHRDAHAASERDGVLRQQLSQHHDEHVVASLRVVQRHVLAVGGWYDNEQLRTTGTCHRRIMRAHVCTHRSVVDVNDSSSNDDDDDDAGQCSYWGVACVAQQQCNTAKYVADCTVASSSSY
jgi:hypothetical protein